MGLICSYCPGMNLDLLQKAANQARGLAMDAVHDCASGQMPLFLYGNADALELLWYY